MPSSSGGDPSAALSMNNESLSGAVGVGNAQFPSGIPGFAGNASGSAMGIGMGAQPTQQFGVGASVTTGGVPGVSSEMMQSFMQRKVDGSGGQPPGGLA